MPWWSRPEVKLFTIIVHVLNETTRHAGHADILREQVDGQTGDTSRHPGTIDISAREAHWGRRRAGRQSCSRVTRTVRTSDSAVTGLRRMKITQQANLGAVMDQLDVAVHDQPGDRSVGELRG